MLIARQYQKIDLYRVFYFTCSESTFSAAYDRGKEQIDSRLLTIFPRTFFFSLSLCEINLFVAKE